MADTSFTAQETNIVSTWLNVINNYVYRGINPSYVTSTGAADAQIITISGALETSLTTGQQFTFKAGYTNTGATTLTVIVGATLLPAAVVSPTGVALVAGAITAGTTYTAVWNGTAYELQGGNSLSSGGPLGTPSSGTVTNLTGTASININGTVGATTPGTGAFTTISATGDGTFSGTGQVKLPAGTTGQRSGSPATGMVRFNSSLGTFEGYGASAWGSIGGGATGGGADTVFQENQLIVTTSYTLTTGKSAMSVGPITINGGAVVTIPGGYRWVVL